MRLHVGTMTNHQKLIYHQSAPCWDSGDTGKMFIKVTLASANQASFTPTCPGQQPKSKMKRQNFKWKKHGFGYKTNHSFVTLNKLLVIAASFSLSENSINSFPFNWGGGAPNKGDSLNGSNGTITPDKLSNCQRIIEWESLNGSRRLRD